jgi:hypothetical protein
MSTVARQLTFVVRSSIRDAIRRRLFLVIGLLSAAFLVLYATGLHFIWAEANEEGFGPQGADDGLDPRIIVASTITGLAMFATHFLGAVVATFLVLSAVRGDAELGTLQQVLVRPLSRATYLVGRFLAGALVTAAYVGVMVLACMLITRGITGWWPDAAWLAVLRMMCGSIGLVAVALTGSVFLGSAANGVATFMVFGLALLGGLLDQLGEGINSPATREVGNWVLRVVPFEAMYHWALDALTQDTVGIERLVVNLGPFGGARSYGWDLVLGVGVFCAVLIAFGSWRLRRLDL